MARAPAAAKAATKEQTESKAVVRWDEELAKYATAAATAEAAEGGGQYFSLQSGQLSFDGNPIPGNRMAVVVLSAKFENVYYEGEYNSQQSTPPTCFAFADEKEGLKPHPSVVAAGQAQHTQCEGCKRNVFGSAERGAGKACRNTRQLALMPAGEIDPKDGRVTLYRGAADFESATIGVYRLQVTSVKGYAQYVKALAATEQRPPFAMFTKVSLVPDARTQHRTVLEKIGKVPDDLMPVMIERMKASQALLGVPYALTRDDAPRQEGRAAGGARRAPAKGKRY